MKCTARKLFANYAKMQLLALGCLVVLLVGVQAEDSCEYLKKELRGGLHMETGASYRSLRMLSVGARKCDGDDDGALNAAEFSGCLHQLVNSVRTLGEDDLKERSGCLEKFRSEADQDENDVVDFAEYLRWSSKWARRCRCRCRRMSAERVNGVLQPSGCHGCCCCG